MSEFGETGHPVLGDAVVDVKAVALCAFPGKQKLVRVGLATVVSSVLGAYVDKTEQCSDWERRPLTDAQIDYAAADAHVLTVLFRPVLPPLARRHRDGAGGSNEAPRGGSRGAQGSKSEQAGAKRQSGRKPPAPG